MAHRLKTPEGKKLYTPCANRRRNRCSASSNRCSDSVNFLLRGLDKVRGEWSLVTMAWNMKRMFALTLWIATSRYWTFLPD
jgi:hypothetical protein